jgi:hypothetical protein
MTKIQTRLLRVALCLLCLDSPLALAASCTNAEFKTLSQSFGEGDRFDSVVATLAARQIRFVVVTKDGEVSSGAIKANGAVDLQPEFVRATAKPLPDGRQGESLYFDFDVNKLVTRVYCG